MTYHRVHFHRHQFVKERKNGERDMNFWRGAPPWAIDLLKRQHYTMLQNEAILAKLEDRSTGLSDADQKALDQIMDILKSTNDKIDSANQDE